MTVQMMAIGKIKLNSRNARTHSTKQIRQIANSIENFGFTNPLLVSEGGELIAGEGRYKAATLLGLVELPAIVVRGLSHAKRRALAIADNKIAENGGWNRKRLAIEIPELADELSAEGLDVSLLGFEAIEIEEIQTDAEAEAQDPRDRIDPKWSEAIPVSKPGDLWLLGNHKLLCGDVHSAEDIARLMTGCQANLAFIDSPATEEPSDFIPLLRVALSAAASVSRDGALHFVGTDWRRMVKCMEAARPVYGAAIDCIVWVKSKADDGALYRSQHELIAVFRVATAHPKIESNRHGVSRSNVWRYAERKSFPRGKPELRSPPKPVALIADALKDCTQKGDVILDLFSGVGSTVMAAERVGRRARALEGVPRLVDVAIRRWQAFTHHDAIHADRGLTFEQIAADRAHCGDIAATSKTSRRRP
jgi:hypothetical protein